MDLQNRKQNCFRSLVSSAIILGTATPGGGFQIYGAAYSAVLNETDKTLAIEQRATKGSTENAPLLAEGKLDIGLATGEVTYEALAGIGRPPANLKIINAMYPNSGMFIVHADSPYRTLADLRGKPVAWGASGSGFVVLARYVFDGLGMNIEKDFQAIFLEHARRGRHEARPREVSLHQAGHAARGQLPGADRAGRRARLVVARARARIAAR